MLHEKLKVFFYEEDLNTASKILLEADYLLDTITNNQDMVNGENVSRKDVLVKIGRLHALMLDLNDMLRESSEIEESLKKLGVYYISFYGIPFTKYGISL